MLSVEHYLYLQDYRYNFWTFIYLHENGTVFESPYLRYYVLTCCHHRISSLFLQSRISLSVSRLLTALDWDLRDFSKRRISLPIFPKVSLFYLDKSREQLFSFSKKLSTVCFVNKPLRSCNLFPHEDSVAHMFPN